jgi:hypothetical protein
MSSLFPLSFLRSVTYGGSRLGQLTARAVFRLRLRLRLGRERPPLVTGTTDWGFAPTTTPSRRSPRAGLSEIALNAPR